MENQGLAYWRRSQPPEIFEAGLESESAVSWGGRGSYAFSSGSVSNLAPRTFVASARSHSFNRVA